MKIAILTFHNTQNYGANLQLYALSRFLVLNGHSVEVINFNNNLESNSLLSMTKTFIKRNFIFFFKYKFFFQNNPSIQSFIKFNEFRKRMKFSKLVSKYNIGSLENDYDKFVVGSDQVWNPEITMKNSIYYLLNFVKDKKKRISYAASSGNLDIFKKKFNEFSPQLKQFHRISCREDNLSKFLLSKDLNVPIKTVLDPSFLLSKFEWEKLIPYNYIGDYILVYLLEKDDFIILEVNKILSRFNMKVINITAGVVFPNQKCLDYGVGPLDFLSLIKNAKYVITNSFHGLVFSLIFNINFVVLLPKNRQERLIDLSNRLKLDSRLFKLNGTSKIDISKTLLINFEYDFRELDRFIAESQEFLIEALKF
jgi:hypothetical protein